MKIKPTKQTLIILFLIILLLAVGVVSALLLIGKTKETGATTEETKTYVSGVVEDEQGTPLIASLEVINQADKSKTRFQTDILGKYELALAQGKYEIIVSKGYEYERKSINLTIADRLRKAQPPLRLHKLIDLTAMGWYAGDLHQHSNYSDGYQEVSDILISDLANGLRWGALTDHNTVDGLQEWLHGGTLFNGAGKNEPFTPIPGMEVTTKIGHYNAFGTATLIDAKTDAGAKDIERIVSDAKAANAMIQINHPCLTDSMGFNNWELATQFNTIEIWNGKGVTNDSTNKQAKEKWYELLNAGTFLPATGGSDNHDITGLYLWERDENSPNAAQWADRGLYSGSPRTYVYSKNGAAAADILANVAKGHSFITNGPLVLFSMNGAIAGETVEAASNEANLELQAFDNRTLEKCVLIEDGKSIAEFDMNGALQKEEHRAIPVKKGSWYLVEVFGKDGGYAITNPIFFN